eukprot:TRINITY_DN1851_c0_g1_i2.p1 TRINITY_DN1851_c0_g1~~TRINITY_DN1851_c0_g1_i2.p1  ORF type:complete len:694 (+),score=120.85 TRINITY_DN1851_c0_g1_i2:106-2187(+)
MLRSLVGSEMCIRDRAMGGSLSAAEYLRPTGISRVLSRDPESQCCCARLLPVRATHLELHDEPEQGAVLAEHDIEIQDFPLAVQETLGEIFDSLVAQHGGDGYLVGEGVQAYCAKLGIPESHLRDALMTNRIVRQTLQSVESSPEKASLSKRGRYDQPPEDGLTKEQFLALWKPAVVNLSTVDPKEVYDCCVELRRLSFSGEGVPEGEKIRSLHELPDQIRQGLTRILLEGSSQALSQSGLEQLYNLGLSKSEANGLQQGQEISSQELDVLLNRCLSFVNQFSVHKRGGHEACCCRLEQILDSLTHQAAPPEAEPRSATALRLSIRQAQSIIGKRKELEQAFNNLAAKEEKEEKMAALYQEAKQNPQSARWLEQFSARLKNLQSKRDSASKSLRKLRQGCEDEIENNLRRFLISIGAETSGFSIGAESIGAEISGLVEPVLSRETLLEMVGAAHKQAARFTHGELDRIQAKLHIFESYCVSLEEEAKSGARWVGPVSPESLLEARDEVKTTTTALANQICQSKTPLVAEQKADLALIHWDLVRLQVICLNAVRAGFKVTRDTTAHDALSTTTIRAHEPGTRWSLQDVKELLKKLEVVKADALGACQEIQRMGFLFACDPKVITWEKLCDCFKDTVRQIQLQQKSGRLNKLQAQVSSLSAEITAEESRLVLLSDEEIETAILRLGQQYMDAMSI